MGDNNDIDDKKLDQNERDTKRKKAKVKGKVTGAILKTIFLKVIIFLSKIAGILLIYASIYALIEKVLGPIRTENMPKQTLEIFDKEKLEELVVVKGTEETGYYLGYCEDFDEKIVELSEKFVKEHNLLGTKEETVEKMIKAQIVTQYPNLGGKLTEEQLEERLAEKEMKDLQMGQAYCGGHYHRIVL